MTISPDMSDSGDQGLVPSHFSAPLTPITPGHGMVNGVFPMAEYGEVSSEPQQVGYPTMPNKHYARHQYSTSGQYNEFGQVQGYVAIDGNRQWQ
jgi:hypothetical protein